MLRKIAFLVFNRSCVPKRGFHVSCVGLQKLTVTEQSNGVRSIVLNDAKTRNSLSMSMMDSILEDITRDKEDKSLRCIVLSANGPVFSAGHNFKELTQETSDEFHREVFEKCAEVVQAIRESQVPVIAKVDGLAAAAGCQLVASCDIVVCSDKSQFSTPGVNFGVFCSTPGIALARVVPRMQAAHMLFTGLPMSAEKAYLFGLVTAVVPKEELDTEVGKICENIKTKSRSVIHFGKNFFYQQIAMNTREAYRQGAYVMAKNLCLEDGKEGVSSFVEKRKPKWTY